MGFTKESNFTFGDSRLFNSKNYFTYHSYTYNKKYNTFWQGFALQLIPCLEKQGNKKLKGGYKK